MFYYIKVLRLKKVSKTFIKYYCEKVQNKYSQTIFLPKTTLSLRLDGEKRKEMDEHVLKEGNFNNLYKHYEISKSKVFVLHDGPPYANGSPHIGHAINKILKDITNRAKLLRGYQVHYIPGWDCHGLPIELKATTNETDQTTKDRNDLQESMHIRNQARKFAEEAIQIQMSAFKRWGIIANWDKCYYTFHTNYVIDQLTLFYKLYSKGLIFRDFKPVYWSYSTKTALAEAELEYNSKHKSTSVFFKCLLKPRSELFGSDDVYALVWTTTPWTIPCNKAICYAHEQKYCIAQCTSSNEKYLIAQNLKSNLENTLSKQFLILKEIDGNLLKDSFYYHPISNEEFPLLPGRHVTTDVGTGLVHAAPAHGPDDFLIAVENKISVECHVDEEGKYTKEMGPLFEGKFVLKEGNQTVLNLLGDKMLFSENYFHSYPYDWRSKKPVIVRASSQWFFDVDQIKSKAINSLNGVNVFPSEAKMAMIAQLKNRPFWCISRQRVWGVPIPVFYDTETKDILFNKNILDHLIKLIEKHGTDFWWTLPDDILLPKHLLNEASKSRSFEKGSDILDIWFDSGSSWNHVLKDFNGESDILFEGTDQITGWFQSTLLLSSALNEKSPYKNLFIHGFAIDEQGKKMSKSVGNVVDPKVITDGGHKKPCYGADVLRWWVAAHGIGHLTIPVGDNIMKMCYEDVQKLRGVLRFLVGTLNDYKLPDEVIISSLLGIDQYMLHQLVIFKKEVIEAYNNYSYNRVAKLIKMFVSGNVSSFYCHLVKDRIYCDSIQSWKRQSALFVIQQTLNVILQLLSPVLPFLTEEVYINYSEGKQPSISSWALPCMDNWENNELFNSVEKILKIRNELNKLAAANKFRLGDADLIMIINAKFAEELEIVQTRENSVSSCLCEFFQVSQVTLITSETNDYIESYHSNDDRDTDIIGISSSEICRFILKKSNKCMCPRCRRRISVVNDVLCERCEEAVNNLK